MRLTEIHNADRCRDYLLEIVAGGRSLAQAMKSMIPQFTIFYTLLPDDGQILDFWKGGHKRSIGVGNVRIEEVEDDNVQMAEFLASLAEDGPAAILIEDNVGRRGDRSLDVVRNRLMFNGEDVYHVLARPDGIEKSDVAELMKAGFSAAPTIGILAKPDGFVIDAINATSEMTAPLLEQVKSASELLFAEAYDGESFLIASRKGLN